MTSRSNEPVPPTTLSGSRLFKSIGPIVGGFLIDVVDLATMGPLGLWAGAVAGGLAAYFLLRNRGFSAATQCGVIASAALYCTLPFTEFLPLGTLLGALLRFLNDESVSRRT